MILSEKLVAKGHINIKSTHKTTFEITKDKYVTLKGDCIIGICSNKSVSELSPKFKEKLRNDNTILVIFLKTQNYEDIVLAHGSSKLKLTNSSSIVIRKSSFIDDRTIGIRANKAACDLNRRMIDELKNPNTILRVILVLTDDEQLSYAMNFIREKNY